MQRACMWDVFLCMCARACSVDCDGVYVCMYVDMSGCCVLLIQDNSFEEMPALGAAPFLRHLNINGCSLTSFPELSAMPQLLMLDVGFNDGLESFDLAEAHTKLQVCGSHAHSSSGGSSGGGGTRYCSFWYVSVLTVQQQFVISHTHHFIALRHHHHAPPEQE